MNIGAVWESIGPRVLYGSTGISIAYVASILFSYRKDMLATQAEKAIEDKTPIMMRRASIQAFLAKS